MGHELVGDLLCEGGIETAPDVDRSEFPVLALVIGSEFLALELEVGLLSVRLGVNRNVLVNSLPTATPFSGPIVTPPGVKDWA